ncbi:MAG: type II toxin-antitoxin system RatA family toxin [Alphaproteobacteria bacterium]|nr:type II toxin-antitoxin system RatA family toxin [Alphaproteobacteria bacterium]
MHRHAEKRVLPHTAKQMFDLVADVERYPEFLPWCTGVRIVKREDQMFMADLMIGYKVIREKFTSRVELSPHELIKVTYMTGPLKELNNDWRFQDNGDGSCTIDFFIEFEFRSRLFERLIGGVFNEIVKRMVGAFVSRADDLYGSDQRLHQL